MKTLIITEKPSVARDLAHSLGSFEQKDNYMLSEKYLITWAYGHLLELAEPEDYNKAYKFWTLQKLPILPEKFEWKPITKSEKQLKNIVSLMKKKEIASVINACDAGREGELIFRNIYEHAQSDKPHQRLWLSSMTAEAIKNAFQQLREGTEFDPLAQAAKCRSEADWIVGINATRAVTRRLGDLFSLGRVQTPTLAILVDRELEIRQFLTRKYYELSATFKASKIKYPGKWFDPKASDPSIKHELESLEKATQIQEKIKDQAGKIIELKSKESKEQHPLLFDLTDLQREANKRFGYSAATTLSIAQKLYEEKKILTYPRTDSRYLPSDMQGEIPEILQALAHAKPFENLVNLAKVSTKKPGKRVFDNAKVSDHFAIIPTKEKPKMSSLSAQELKIYDLVVRRFLTIFFEAAIYKECTLITSIAEELFESKEKILIDPGYRKVYGEEAKNPLLSTLEKKLSVSLTSTDIEEKETKPRPRFSEATLLTAMQTAGKLVDDDELREALKEKGMGTPATRAQIIERLLHVQYCERQGKELVPTEKGIYLIQLLQMIPLPELSSPELTGLWEKKLLEIEKNQLSEKTFKEEMVAFTQNMIEKIKKADFDALEGSEVGRCPLCQAPVTERGRTYLCNKNCGFKLSKRILSCEITPAIAKELLKDGKTSQLLWFKSSQGKKFQAHLKLENNEIKFEFVDRNAILNQEPCGPCPKCKNNIYEKVNAFQCENEACTFKISKKILGRTMLREEIMEMLKKGKSKKLTGFWSKNRKPFSACLVLNSDGGLSFDFSR
jgi:DNA topoisomerase III